MHYPYLHDCMYYPYLHDYMYYPYLHYYMVYPQIYFHVRVILCVDLPSLWRTSSARADDGARRRVKTSRDIYQINTQARTAWLLHCLLRYLDASP